MSEPRNGRVSAHGPRNRLPSAREIGVEDLVRRMFATYGVDDVSPERIPQEHDRLTWGELKRLFALPDDIEKRAHITLPDNQPPDRSRLEHMLSREVDRRTAVKLLAIGLVLGFGFLQTACRALLPVGARSDREREKAKLSLEEYFKRHYRLMTDEEKRATIERLERLYELETGKRPHISTQGPIQGVLYGYAFNISKCRGYLECIRACIEENNLDRGTDMRYIRIHEIPAGGSAWPGPTTCSITRYPPKARCTWALNVITVRTPPAWTSAPCRPYLEGTRRHCGGRL
ncbi:MAG: hypothetical protein Q9O62_07615 [Ardenticatenia bacterium]|nr:hypothetical protein [Ardenticatenia bacterium]